MVNSSSAATAPVGIGDFVDIQRLIHRYADAVVHRDVEQWGSCWAADAIWHLGHERTVEGRSAIVQLWLSAMEGMAAVVQMVHNGDAWHTDAGSDCATGQWYIDERFRRANGAVGILLAHYDDAYVRTRDGWLFSSRVLRVHYLGPPDLSAEFKNTAEVLAAGGVGNA